MMVTKPVTLAMGSFQVKVIESNSIPSRYRARGAYPERFFAEWAVHCQRQPYHFAHFNIFFDKKFRITG